MDLKKVIGNDNKIIMTLYMDSIKNGGLKYWHIIVGTIIIPAIIINILIEIAFLLYNVIINKLIGNVLIHLMSYIISPVKKGFISFLNRPVYKMK